MIVGKSYNKHELWEGGYVEERNKSIIRIFPDRKEEELESFLEKSLPTITIILLIHRKNCLMMASGIGWLRNTRSDERREKLHIYKERPDKITNETGTASL